LSELKVSALYGMVNKLRPASLAVAQTGNMMANARMHRNKVINGQDGMLKHQMRSKITSAPYLAKQ
jgi:hypothetical protein